MVAILMMSQNLANLGLLKLKQDKASESFRIRFPNSLIKGKVMCALPCILNACKELYIHRKTSLNFKFTIIAVFIALH